LLHHELAYCVARLLRVTASCWLEATGAGHQPGWCGGCVWTVHGAHKLYTARTNCTQRAQTVHGVHKLCAGSPHTWIAHISTPASCPARVRHQISPGLFPHLQVVLCPMLPQTPLCVPRPQVVLRPQDAVVLWRGAPAILDADTTHPRLCALWHSKALWRAGAAALPTAPSRPILRCGPPSSPACLWQHNDPAQKRCALGCTACAQDPPTCLVASAWHMHHVPAAAAAAAATAATTCAVTLGGVLCRLRSPTALPTRRAAADALAALRVSMQNTNTPPWGKHPQLLVTVLAQTLHSLMPQLARCGLTTLNIICMV